MAYQPGPNDLLREARLTRRSPSGSGRPMSRQELAEAVNAYLYEHAGRRFAADAGYIGNLERGQHRWPSAHYRTALRAVLGKATDADLGFFIIQGHANDPDVNAAEPDAPAEASDAAPLDLGATTAIAVAIGPAVAPIGEAGTGLPNPDVPAEGAAVQVSVNAGTAVTVVCHDGPPGRVAVVAGTVQVLIDTSDTDPVSLAAVVDPPMVAGEARVYSIAEQRAR